MKYYRDLRSTEQSFRMTLSDLAKYSMTRSARGLSAAAERLVYCVADRKWLQSMFIFSTRFYTLYNIVFMWIAKSLNEWMNISLFHIIQQKLIHCTLMAATLTRRHIGDVSVCPSHAGIESKLLTVGSYYRW